MTRELENVSLASISRDWTISRIFEQYPEFVNEVSECLLDYGLHCVGCAANTFESIEQGGYTHGMPDDMIDSIVGDLNKIVSASRQEFKGALICITESAESKVIELISEKDADINEVFLKVSSVKKGCGCGKVSYELTFTKVADEGYNILDVGKIKVLVSDSDREFLKGSSIDYLSESDFEGFRVNNPNVSSSCGCGGSY